MQSIMLALTLLLSCVTLPLYCMNPSEKLKTNKKNKQKSKSQRKKEQKNHDDLAFLNQCAEENKNRGIRPNVIVQKGYKKAKPKKIKSTRARKNILYNTSNNKTDTRQHPMDDRLFDTLVRYKDNQRVQNFVLNSVWQQYGENLSAIDQGLMEAIITQAERMVLEQQECERQLLAHQQLLEQQVIKKVPQEEASGTSLFDFPDELFYQR